MKNWLVPFEGSKRCCRYLLVTCKILFRKGEGMFLFFRTFFETFLFFLCGFWYRLIVQWWEICYFNYSFIWLIVILLILTFGLYGYLVISFLINYCKQLVIVYGLSVIDMVTWDTLFPDIRIWNIGNTINWITICQTVRKWQPAQITNLRWNSRKCNKDRMVKDTIDR